MWCSAEERRDAPWYTMLRVWSQRPNGEQPSLSITRIASKAWSNSPSCLQSDYLFSHTVCTASIAMFVLELCCAELLYGMCVDKLYSELVMLWRVSGRDVTSGNSVSHSLHGAADQAVEQPKCHSSSSSSSSDIRYQLV